MSRPRKCIYCGGWFTGEPLRPLRVLEAEEVCGACELRVHRELFANDGLTLADLMDWWIDLIPNGGGLA